VSYRWTNDGNPRVDCVYRGESKRYVCISSLVETDLSAFHIFLVPPLVVGLDEYTFQGFFTVAWPDNAKFAEHCGLPTGNNEYLTQVGSRSFTLT
jgi:hypothetical protein